MAGPAPILTAAARERGRLGMLAPTPRQFSLFYSGFVRWAKIVLPAAAVGLAALVLLWPQFNPIEGRFRLSSVSIGPEDIENLRMVNPRFHGADNKSQPYWVTADQANQEAASSELTELTRPKADITLEDGSWLAAAAEHGTYRRVQRQLDLSGGVSLFHDRGYEMHTSAASIDLANGQASGDTPVHAQGPDTKLDGQGFRILDRGATVIVTGQSRLVIVPDPRGGPK